MSKEITNKAALRAYNTLKEYCEQQDCCNDCLLVVSEDWINPDCYCLMHLGKPPGNWEDLEL